MRESLSQLILSSLSIYIIIEIAAFFKFCSCARKLDKGENLTNVAEIAAALKFDIAAHAQLPADSQLTWKFDTGAKFVFGWELV